MDYVGAAIVVAVYLIGLYFLLTNAGQTGEPEIGVKGGAVDAEARPTSERVDPEAVTSERTTREGAGGMVAVNGSR